MSYVALQPRSESGPCKASQGNPLRYQTHADIDVNMDSESDAKSRYSSNYEAYGTFHADLTKRDEANTK